MALATSESSRRGIRSASSLRFVASLQDAFLVFRSETLPSSFAQRRLPRLSHILTSGRHLLVGDSHPVLFRDGRMRDGAEEEGSYE